MLGDFKCHTMAVEIYKKCKKLRVPSYIKIQLLRASSSVALNLNEGNDRRTTKDRVKFFNIAYTSLKEVESIMMLEEIKHLNEEIDQLSAMIFVLIRNRS